MTPLIYLQHKSQYIFFKSTDDKMKGDDVETERSFVCRMKCILNTSAGFFKVKHLKKRESNFEVLIDQHLTLRVLEVDA